MNNDVEYMCTNGSNEFFAAKGGVVTAYKVIVNGIDDIITGMCIIGKLLFVAYANKDLIRVYNSKTGKLLCSSNAYKSPRELSTNRKKLWGIVDGDVMQIFYTKDGQLGYVKNVNEK